MINYIVAAVVNVSCPAADLINESKEPWGKQDVDVITMAVYRCNTAYSKCLKKLIKREPQVYWAICGGSYERR